MEKIRTIDGGAEAVLPQIEAARTGAGGVTIEDREQALKTRYSEASSWFQRELSLHERGTPLAFARDNFEILRKAKETGMPEESYLTLFSMAGFEKLTMRKINELIAVVAEEKQSPTKDRKRVRQTESEDRDEAIDRNGGMRVSGEKEV